MKTTQQLRAFEQRILKAYNDKVIKSPIHLAHGNEETLIELFKDIQPDDWVFSTWRSHYHCLLKGVPEQEIEHKILDGFSISMCFKKYKIYSSAIVGGILPIAIGTAMSIKRRNSVERVWCFIGDTTSETGIAHESIKYARNHELPIKFIIEDNGQAISSNTRQIWNQDQLTYQDANNTFVYWYQYKSHYPHSGGIPS
jgi:TPP-dependent pyruvate/acetoin dehydrogenase alpha subunit